MAATDPRIDAYIAKSAAFAQPILERLRELVHEACPQVEETIKWGMPTFVLAGRNLCGMAAFKQHASFGFWQHALVMGEGVARDGMGSIGRLTTLRDVPSRTRMLALIRKAVRLNRHGVKTPRTPDASTAPKPAPPARRPGLGARAAQACAGTPAFRGIRTELPARLHRMAHRGQARGDARTTACAGTGVSGGRQAAQLEVHGAVNESRPRCTIMVPCRAMRA